MACSSIYQGIEYHVASTFQHQQTSASMLTCCRKPVHLQPFVASPCTYTHQQYQVSASTEEIHQGSVSASQLQQSGGLLAIYFQLASQTKKISNLIHLIIQSKSYAGIDFKICGYSCTLSSLDCFPSFR